jgi:uncharacterized protein YbjQ (UPF0145 family)
MSEEPPATVEAGAGEAGPAGARSGETWGSTLTCQELAAVTSAGFFPVGQVFGAAVYAAGSASVAGCPGVQVPGQGDPGTFVPLVEAMYQARRAAIDRMTAECAALGGHGVAGVRLSREPFPLGGLAFTAIGTAVRAQGAATRPEVPFSCDLSGQDFARLIAAGWVPAGMAFGIAIGARHDDRVTARQARLWSGNAEMAGWTELVNRSRREARHRLEEDIRRVGAEGVVTADMEMRVRQRDCPEATGRHDHIVEVTFTGTAIVRFSPAGHTYAGPALTVMSLGPRRGERVVLR